MTEQTELIATIRYLFLNICRLTERLDNYMNVSQYQKKVFSECSTEVIAFTVIVLSRSVNYVSLELFLTLRLDKLTIAHRKKIFMGQTVKY